MSTKPKHVATPDEEAEAIKQIVALLAPMGFDSAWRVLNYLVIRFLGRSWSLPKPQTDTK